MIKLTDIDKLKYWLDAEISIVHAMIAFVLLNIVTNGWYKAAIIVYIVLSLAYSIVRIAYLSNADKNYLQVPKK